jgi:hypothetical protein
MLFGLSSCWSGSDKITSEIVGTYSFKFPTGEYQLLKINSDSTFLQDYYKNYNSFKIGDKPISFSKGKWYKTSEYQLGFEDFIEICYMSNPDSILPKPKYVNQLNVYWNKASMNTNAELSIYYENGYVFEKID